MPGRCPARYDTLRPASTDRVQPGREKYHHSVRAIANLYGEPDPVDGGLRDHRGTGCAAAGDAHRAIPGNSPLRGPHASQALTSSTGPGLCTRSWKAARVTRSRAVLRQTATAALMHLSSSRRATWLRTAPASVARFRLRAGDVAPRPLDTCRTRRRAGR